MFAYQPNITQFGVENLLTIKKKVFTEISYHPRQHRPLVQLYISPITKNRLNSKKNLSLREFKLLMLILIEKQKLETTNHPNLWMKEIQSIDVVVASKSS